MLWTKLDGYDGSHRVILARIVYVGVGPLPRNISHDTDHVAGGRLHARYCASEYDQRRVDDTMRTRTSTH